MQENDSRRLLFHVVATIHFAFGCYYDWNYVKVPTNVHIMGIEFAGKLKFLTYWDAILQTFFFAICVLNDWLGSNSKDPQNAPFLRKLKDMVFTSLAFPVAMFVGVTFWALYAVDRELVFPRALDAFFPVWLNHLMHTNIMIFILVEMIVSYRKYPKPKHGMTLMTAFFLAYLIWMHVVYYRTNVWVYPIMEVMNVPTRVCFISVLLGMGLSLYKLGDTLNSKIWAGQERKLKSK